MEGLEKRVAYLQGLADGIEVEDSKAGRLIDELIDVLVDVVEVLAEFKENQVELEEYVTVIDEDLEDLEEEVYDDDDDDDDEFAFDDFYNDEDDEDLDDDISYVEVECPECHDIVYFDSDILIDDDLIEVVCPNCNTVVFVNDDSLETIDEFVEDEESEEEGDEE